MLRSFAGAGAGALLGAVAVAATAGPVSATQGQPVLAGLDNTAAGTTRVQLNGGQARYDVAFEVSAAGSTVGAITGVSGGRSPSRTRDT